MNSLPKTSVLSQSHVPSYSLFAQLLASERLRVTVDRNAHTASFAPEARILTLPSWSNFDNDAWLLFIAHEVGHALYTPADSLTCPSFEALAKQYGRGAVLGVANVFEDVRIERLVREKYRGLAGTFSRGYHSLMTRKFFGFDTLSQDDWSSKTALDRINVYAKVGGLLRLSLTEAQEIAWFNRALRANTYEEILALVADVMKELTEEQRQQAAQAAQNNQPSQGQTAGQPQSGQSQEAPSSNDAQQGQPSQNAQGESSQGQSSQDAKSNESNSSQSNSSQSSESESKNADAQDAKSGESKSQSEPTQGESPASNSQGQPQENAQPTDAASSDPFAIPSQQAAENLLREASEQGRYDSSNVTAMLPISSAHLHYNDRSIEEMLGEWKATPEQREYFRTLAHQQRREQSTILASMIAAFRANQSAWQSRRVQVSRSGVIDTAKLAQYKLTEDLFLRRRSLPEAQNHGFVLHVDWSGSMEGKMSVVLWQVLHLIWFAESIKVPVSVYGFSNAGTETEAGRDYATKCRANYRHPERGRLVELYRSNASAQVKQDAQAFLFALVLRFSGLTGLMNWDLAAAADVLNDPEQVQYRVPGMPKSVLPVAKMVLPVLGAWERDAQHDVFYHPQVSLGGTPLHYALVSAVDTVRKFRQVHRVEQCISVWLTDGQDTDGTPLAGDLSEPQVAKTRYLGAPDAMPSAGTLVDPRTGRSFKIESGRQLATLFELHRALTGATVICIDITSAPLHSFNRVLGRNALSVIANNVGEPEHYGRRRRRSVVRAKAIKQTRKRVVITSEQGSFDATGLMMVTRAQYPEIGCDAYLVTHPDWWSQHTDSKAQSQHVQSSSSILTALDEEETLTPEEREAEAQNRPVRLAAALREGAAHIAMRRFADLLVPYMAAGRDDASV